ncbi:hypothetical protein [Gordonia jinghuaiqii]|nr:hypothetical protein [Gordonia jinghuaiqii]
MTGIALATEHLADATSEAHRLLDLTIVGICPAAMAVSTPS